MMERCDCGTCPECITIFDIYENNLQEIVLNEFFSELKAENERLNKLYSQFLDEHDENNRLRKEAVRLREALVDIYWQTTCKMTTDYLKNKVDIDFEKALKEQE